MMRFLGVLVLAGFPFGTALQAQEKSTLSTYRVFPKPGKDVALRKATTGHATKYHTGNWEWHVFGVISGPDEGSYQFNFSDDVFEVHPVVGNMFFPKSISFVGRAKWLS
jgi:hypothetical protein